jgi:DNA-binding NarL/FixJ family response regulator
MGERMNLAEINRRLKDADPQTRYIIAFMFENLMEITKQLDACADALLSMSEALSDQTKLNSLVSEDIRRLRKHTGAHFEGESVTDDPEDLQ